MIRSSLSAAAALAASALPGGASPTPAVDGVEITQLRIRERVIIHVPRMARSPRPLTWKEKKGPRCLDADSLAGALIREPRSVDLVVRGGQRYRARLDGDCEQLDYYSGFYIRPTPDGMICADRDVIRVRSGASCQIDSFRLLKAVP